MPQLGELDERVTVKNSTETHDANNEPTQTWANYMHAWAKVEPLRGSEVLDRGVRNPEASYRVFVLHHADKLVTVGMRVFWTPRRERDATEQTLDIVYVRRVTGKRRFVEILCTDHTA